ncbi:MAG TPA: ATP-dependent zinc metalloprotease FtsH [Verrucomicrobiota bacterium]|nr:ATP-dependent zinc metalloprotease FtsH [Verrucomicrobiota bacterium]HNU52574.1 ATP-dependent zinc metalloprotease FtsH [Verrucomicrobiota bacterium]
MSDDYKNESGRNERRGGDPRVSPRTMLMWLIIFSLVPLAIFFRDRSQSRHKVLNHLEFLHVVESNLVTEATIYYNPQSLRREIVGKLADTEGGKAGVPFKIETRLSEALEDQLLRTGRFKVAEPNTVFWNLFYGILPFLLLAGLVYFFLIRQIKSAGKGALSFGKSKARMLNREKNRTTFKDVAGIEEAKDEVSELVEFLKDPKKFQKLGGRIPKGILMVGPPGTGKTLLAKAIAGEAEAAFYSISGSDFVEMFVGVGASRVRDMFEQARKNTPCLVFIDEIDAVGRSRGHGLGGGNDEREQTLNALLVEMDGFDTTDGIIIIAATNRPDVLDPALLRPGRFDRQITVNLPDVRGREAILKVHAKNVKLAPDIDLSVIARGTPGFSGAELANLLNEAALLAARLNKKLITMKELEEARDKVRWGRERRSLAMTEEQKRFTAWHEAGHALVNVMLEHTHPLHKVTIIPRGQALGATMYLPKEDILNRGRKEMLDLITVTMGGRIAEEVISGDVSTGAAGDIQQATQMARAMVCHFGMSEKLGMVQYGEDNEYIFLGRDMVRGKEYSERTAQEIDAEVKRIIDECYQKAHSLIHGNLDKLETIAKSLLEFETLEGAQVEEIVRTGRLTPPPPPPASGPPTGAEAATPLPEVPKPLPPKLPPGLGAPAPAPV